MPAVNKECTESLIGFRQRQITNQIKEGGQRVHDYRYCLRQERRISCKYKCRLENVMRKEGRQKRILASLLVFAMLVTMLPMNLFSGSTFKAKAEGEETPESTNYVVNGDFEANTDSAVISKFTSTTMNLGSSGWKGQQNGLVEGIGHDATETSLEIVANSGKDNKEGNHVVKIKASDKCYLDLFQWLTENNAKNGTAKLEAGAPYVATMWIKATDAYAKNETPLVTRLRYVETADGASNGSAEVAYELSGTSEWTKVELQFTPLSNKQPSLKFTVNGKNAYDSGEIYIDDIAVEELNFSLDQQTMELSAGASNELAVSTNVTTGTLVWTSSDDRVATVTADAEDSNKATVTAVGTAGQTATVTATLYKAGTTEYTEANVVSKASCNVTLKADETVVKLTGITMSENTAALTEGEEKLLSVTFAPENASDQTISWTSSDDTVATVDQTGKVTAVNAGTATITATYAGVTDKAEGTPSATCVVTVQEKQTSANKLFVVNGDFEADKEAEILVFPAKTPTVSLGTSGWKGQQNQLASGTAHNETGTLLEVVADSGKDNKEGNHVVKITASDKCNLDLFQWLTENNAKKGTAKLEAGVPYVATMWIKATNAYAKNKTPLVTRLRYAETAVEGLNGSAEVAYELSGNSGWTKVELMFTPLSNSAPALRFTINALSAFESGEIYIDDITICPLPKEPTLTVIPESVTLEVGATTELSAVVDDPDGVLDEPAQIRWSSYNEAVATVDANGKVTAVGVGEAVISVTSTDGKMGTICMVKVENNIPLTGIAMKEATAQMYTGSTKELEIIFTPEDATNKEIVWSSSDETIATVDENGVVTAWKAGTVTITATPVAEGIQAATCSISVRESVLLTTQKAELTTDFGTRLEGELSSYVTVNTRNEVSYQILQGPAIGKLDLNTKTGSFVYVPKGYGQSGHTDTFVVGVTASGESAVINAEITVKPLADSIASKLDNTEMLLVTKEKLEQLRADIKDKNSLNYRLWSIYGYSVESVAKMTPPEDKDPECKDVDGVKCAGDEYYSSEWQRGVGDITAQLLWAYLLTGEEVYKDKCLEYAMTSVNYRHWGSIRRYYEGNLPAAHQAIGIAMVYNWMHDELPAELTPEQLQTMVNKLYKTCGNLERNTLYIETGVDIVTGETLKDPALQYVNNHLMVRMSGLAFGSTALYIHAEDAAATLNYGKDQADWITAEEIRSNCVRWLELVYTMVGRSFENLPGDGSSQEGPGYWQYALERQLMSALILNSNLDIDMITDNAWLENASDFWLNIMLPKDYLGMGGGAIKFSDSDGGLGYGPCHLFRVLAGLYKDETAQWIAQAHEDRKANSKTYNYWLGMMFSDGTVEAKLEADQSKLYYGEDLGIVTARSDWSGKESIFYIRSGLPLGKAANWLLPLGTNESHTDPDNNAIILYSNGEYLLRTDGYSDNIRTANHSTLLVSGMGQIGGNKDSYANKEWDEYYYLDREPVVKVAVNKDGYSYIVGDSTEAYHPDLGLRKFERNVVFIEEENVLLIVDNVMTNKNEDLELRWFPASKIVTESYGVYTMTGKYNKMKFFPFTEETTTAFEEVDVYINSADEMEKAFHQTYNGLSWQNAVAFSWSDFDAEQAYVRYMEGNVNEHKFEVNGKVYTVNVADYTVKAEEGTLNLEPEPWQSDSSLGTVMLNGFAVEGFESDKTEYTVERFWKTDKLVIEALTQSPTATAEVTWDGKCPGTVTIVVTSGDKSSTTTYTLKLTNDKNLLSIQSAYYEPYDEKEPIEFTYDSFVADDGGTDTWAVKNCPVATWDMGKLVDLTKIDVAFNYSAKRGTYYDLYVSEDGENWTLIDRKDDKVGASPITTTGKFNDYVTIWDTPVTARYVRIHIRGNTEGTGKYDNNNAYGSIQEISIYGTEVVNPQIIPERTDTEYKQQSGNTVTITSDGDFSKFVSVEMDGVIVAESNYTAVEGSTVITFKAEYLNSLTPGRHIVTINYKGGASVDSVLTIEAADEPEGSTGDTEGSTEGTEGSTVGSTEGTEGNTEGTEGSTEESTEESTETSTDETEGGTTGGSGNGDAGDDVETGDVSRVGFWMLLMAITLMSGYAALVLKKERE